MAVPVTYMGTKRQLAGHVRKITAECREGAFLDVFSGMCAVGSAISDGRPVWSNDKQRFAVLVAEAHFLSKSGPPNLASILSKVERQVQIFSERANEVLASELDLEKSAVLNDDLTSLIVLYELGSTRRGMFEDVAGQCGTFADRYAGTYFGYRQCVEIDALRQSIENLKIDCLIDEDEYRWLIIALAKSISKISTTTGHFAQPLRPKANNLGKFAAQRRRAVMHEWLLACEQLEAFGDRRWRKRNRVFSDDAEALISGFRRGKERPAVIYADPPYTKDQYSRFYHIYETLVLDDKPQVNGEGLYRSDRFTSQYSLASSVNDSVETLIAICAEIEADLIISYPTNGLLPDSTNTIPEMFFKHYRQVPSSVELPHVHSTFGSSKGKARSSVTERIYWVSSKC